MHKLWTQLPSTVLHKGDRYGLVVGLRRDERVLHNLQDTSKEIVNISSTKESDGSPYPGRFGVLALAR
jgi:hypothetical protein